MKTGNHIVVSIIISGVLYAIFKSLRLASASFVSGVFVDLDHIIDYWVECGLRFNLEQFFNFFDKKNLGNREKIYFVLHGWEWLIILCAASWMTDWNLWVTGLLIGYGHHMVIDEIYNNAIYRLRPYVFGYSLLWRWKNGFANSFPQSECRPKNI